MHLIQHEHGHQIKSKSNHEPCTGLATAPFVVEVPLKVFERARLELFPHGGGEWSATFGVEEAVAPHTQPCPSGLSLCLPFRLLRLQMPQNVQNHASRGLDVEGLGFCMAPLTFGVEIGIGIGIGTPSPGDVNQETRGEGVHWDLDWDWAGNWATADGQTTSCHFWIVGALEASPRLPRRRKPCHVGIVSIEGFLFFSFLFFSFFSPRFPPVLL